MEFLKRIGLYQYADSFFDNGYDSLNIFSDGRIRVHNIWSVCRHETRSFEKIVRSSLFHEKER